MADKRYDRAYFDHWYRESEHAPRSPARLARKVALAVGMAEYYLDRPVRTVLDIGCGEATWRAPLRRLRPKIDYRGLDPSPYVVERFGRSRHVGLAHFGQLEHLRFEQPFDLVVCADVLHYLKASEVKAGLAGFAELLGGVAFIETFTTRDAIVGDQEGFVARSPAWYRKAFAEAGLTAVGSHCYVGPDIAPDLAALERL